MKKEGHAIEHKMNNKSSVAVTDKNQQDKSFVNGNVHHNTPVITTTISATTSITSTPNKIITKTNDVNELDWLPKYRYTTDVQEQVNIEAKSMWEGVSFDDEDD